MTSSAVEFRVRYAETDQMAVVHHRNYFAWFEMARTEWLRQRGHSYGELEKDGILMPVTEVNAKYHASARYEDLVRVTARVASFNKVRLIFTYEVRLAETDQLLCTGRTEHTFINRDGQVVRLHRTHPELVALLAEEGDA